MILTQTENDLHAKQIKQSEMAYTVGPLLFLSLFSSVD